MRIYIYNKKKTFKTGLSQKHPPHLWAVNFTFRQFELNFTFRHFELNLVPVSKFLHLYAFF